MLLVFTLINTVRLLLLCLYYLSCHGISSSEGLICFLDNKSQDHFLSFVATHHTLFHYCQEEMLSVNQQGKSKQFFVELVSIFSVRLGYA